MTPLIKERVEKFSDVVELSSFFVSAELKISKDSFSHKKLDIDTSVKILQFALWGLENLRSWTGDEIRLELQSISDAMDLKIREFLFPLFVAITGNAISVSVIESISILGIDMVRMRLRTAIDILGGISKKKQKTFDKEYRELP